MDLRQPLKRLKTEGTTSSSSEISTFYDVENLSHNNNNLSRRTTGSPPPQTLQTSSNTNSNRMFFRRNGPASVSPVPSMNSSFCYNNNTNSNNNSHNNSINNMDTSSINRDVEPDAPTERLSRHVPNRDDMDINMSSMNLVVENNGGSSNNPMNNNINSNDSSMVLDGNSMMHQLSQDSSLSSSMVITDQNTNMNSVEQENSNEAFNNYRDTLADSFLSTTSSNGGRTRLGGDVLNFNPNNNNNNNNSRHHQNFENSNNNINNNNNSNGGMISRASTSPIPHSAAAGGGGNNSNNGHSHSQQQHSSRHHHHRRSESTKRSNPHQRALNLNPEKVLDAPDLPQEPCQLLDWGSTNELVIGLNSVLYSWNATTGEPRTVCDLSSDENENNNNTNSNNIITGVSWLNSCKSAAMVLNKNRIAIADATKGTIFRWMIPGIDSGLTSNANLELINSMAICGPLVACATNQGTVCIYDMRMAGLASHFDAHTGGISKATFCTQDPNYLATGGSNDGCVRIWDHRSFSVARYNFDRVMVNNNNNNNNNNASTPPSVSAINFFSDKRSIIFAGSTDGQLLSLNTHGNPEDYIVANAFCGNSPITSILSSPGTGEIATSHGVNGGVVQLRRAHRFQHLGSFCGPGTTSGINCLTLAPDGERVCGAQLDETLKFWKVFDRSSSSNNGNQQQQRHQSSLSQQQQPQQAPPSASSSSQQQQQHHHFPPRNHIISAGERIRQRQVQDDDGDDYSSDFIR